MALIGTSSGIGGFTPGFFFIQEKGFPALVSFLSWKLNVLGTPDVDCRLFDEKLKPEVEG